MAGKRGNGGSAPLTTPDGRYIVVVGTAGPRLWRASNPNIADDRRAALVEQLMNARRSIRANTDGTAVSEARGEVDKAKRALGERGPVWWDDGAPDLNRRLVKNSPYADWYEAIGKG